MVKTKTTPEIKSHKRLTMPASVREDGDQKHMWEWAAANYRYQGADRLALTMLCHAWSKYCKAYQAELKDPVTKASSPMTAWYDRVTKMMFCLGMMPSQRQAAGGPDGGADPLETRGPGGFGDDDEGE
jgi:hypothetical protein